MQSVKVEQITPGHILPGKSTSLLCTLSLQRTKPNTTERTSIIWLKNDQKIFSGSTRYLTEDTPWNEIDQSLSKRLTITENNDKTDEGYYFCSVTFSNKTLVSKKVFLRFGGDTIL